MYNNDLSGTLVNFTPNSKIAGGILRARKLNSYNILQGSYLLAETITAETIIATCSDMTLIFEFYLTDMAGEPYRIAVNNGNVKITPLAGTLSATYIDIIAIRL